MIKIENVSTVGWEAAIRGARNPMNSWEKSDSLFIFDYSDHGRRVDAHKLISEHTNQELYEDPTLREATLAEIEYAHRHSVIRTGGTGAVYIGPNDLKLLTNLAKAGSDEAKFRRMIVVYLDVTAPMYWWKEADTYKVGTVRNSCSTMHKIHAKEFAVEDFSTEHLETLARFDEDGEMHKPYMVLKVVIDCLNACRNSYLQTKNKTDWWQMIQLLPSSYNQRATLMLNYEVLANMYHARKNHKLDEWKEFCSWIESLPYAKELIIGGE